MAKMNIHRGDGAILLWNLPAFSSSFSWVEIFPGWYNFPDANVILTATPPAYALHVDTPPVWHTTHATCGISAGISAFCLL